MRLEGNFSQSVMCIWSNLSEEFAELGTIMTFKGHLDSCVAKKGLEIYGAGAARETTLVG